jgi:hypothetical protein
MVNEVDQSPNHPTLFFQESKFFPLNFLMLKSTYILVALELSLIPNTSTNKHYSWRELVSHFPFLWHFSWCNVTWQA